MKTHPGVQLLRVWTSLSFFFFFPVLDTCSTHLHPLGNPLYQLPNLHTCPSSFFPSVPISPWLFPTLSFWTQTWRTSNGWSFAGYWKNNQSPAWVLQEQWCPLTVHTAWARPWAESLRPALSDRTFCSDGNVLVLFGSVWCHSLRWGY